MRYKTLWTHPAERSRVTFPFVTWENQFTEEELNAIVAYCRTAKEVVPGTTFGESDARQSDIAFHGWSEEMGWVYERLNRAITMINDRWFNFDLNGYDAFQYTEYYAERQGRYDWHMDMHMGNENIPKDMFEPRKLSLSLILNEPGEDFEGGDFQINCGREAEALTAPQKKGLIIAFPSWMLHRVTPVTRGIRRSLVVWVVGPKFV